MDEKKNSGQETLAEKGKERFVTAEEKAQYEVFANGTISREQIGNMIDNDLRAVISFAHGMLRDKEVHDAVVDVYFKRYQALHLSKKENGNKP